MPGRGGAKSKGKKKSPPKHTPSAARPQSAEQNPSSFRTKAKPVETKGKHSPSGGAAASIAATKGRQSTGSTGSLLEVKGGPPVAGSRTSSASDTREKGNRKKMASSEEDMEEEDMDWQRLETPAPGDRELPQPNYSGTSNEATPYLQTDQREHGKAPAPRDRELPQPNYTGTSSEATPLLRTDHKATKSPSATTSPTPTTGKSEHSDHGQPWSMDDKGRRGDKGQGQESPSAAGGEGHQDDFSDYEDPDAGGYASDEENQTQKPIPYDANRAGKGLPLTKLRTTPQCLPPDLKLERSNQHFIAIRTPFDYKPNEIPPPNLGSTGKWDTDHVRMPFAYESKCLKDGRAVRRWDVIVKAWNAPIRGPFELEEAILKYNQRYVNKWKFTVLHHFFLKHVKRDEREQFFENVLPEMIRLALRLPEACALIPLLKKGKPKKLTLSQYQIACLLANAFLCTFPLRNSRTRGCEYSDYPDINFSHLFIGDPVSRKMQKLKCIVHYFKKVLFKAPTGIVTFSRQVLSSSYNWYSSMDSLTGLHVSSTGTIEDNGRGMLQVDFANKYLGGGVLGHGCVQEEIRFMVCPEMIITRLFTQSLDPLESLVMTGCERYSDYEGYSDSFRWNGDYDDNTPRDCLGRRCCEVVAIDAQIFKSDYGKQFKRASIERELNKAYSGFKTSAKEVNTPALCTGNWGCGAFGGDKQLKALIQIMAASVSKRDVCYFTFGDELLTKELSEVHDLLRKKEKTVGDVYNMLEDYGRTELGGRWSRSRSLFEFIHRQLAKDFKAVRKPTNTPRSNSMETDQFDNAQGTWFRS